MQGYVLVQNLANMILGSANIALVYLLLLFFKSVN